MATSRTSNVLERELQRLEQRLEQLTALCRQLQEENRALHEAQDTLVNERAGLLARNEQARTRVEAMIHRLRALEEA